MAIINMDQPEDKARIQEPKPTPKIHPNEEVKKVPLTKDQILDIIDSTLSDEGLLFDMPFTFINKGNEVTLNLKLKILDALDNLKIQKEIYKQYGNIKVQDFFVNYQKYQDSIANNTLDQKQVFDFIDYFEVFRDYAADYVAKSVVQIDGQPKLKVKVVVDGKEKEVGYFESDEVFKFFLIKTGSSLFEVLYKAMTKNNEYTEAMEKSKKS